MLNEMNIYSLKRRRTTKSEPITDVDYDSCGYPHIVRTGRQSVYKPIGRRRVSSDIDDWFPW